MPARTGEQYVEELDRRNIEVWIHGEKVEGKISEHPAFRNIVRSLAELYDLQHHPDFRDEMTYVSPLSGERVGMSFLIPKTREDLVRRRKMMKRWADHSGGMMGRSPDYLNSALMACAAAADFFAEDDPRYGENIRNYYQYVRENDLSLTHTLIHPQANRSVGASKQKDPFLAARIVEKNSKGVVIRGARMLATLGGVTDEIMVFPSTLLKAGKEDDPYAFAFSIPCDTPGLKFLCRESFDYGKSPFDHPLGAQFEEIDSVVIFDDVLVPWDRIFMLGHAEIGNRLYRETNAVVHMAHQVVTKNVAKTEFILGVLAKMVDMVQIDRFQHVQEKLAEVIIVLEAMRAFLRASEADAKTDRWGMMTPDFGPLNAARNYYPRIYPRIAEIIQQLGASGLMAIPTEADFKGELRPEIDRYLQAAHAEAEERVRLFRLAWDIGVSAFGGRQVLYERFFFGDPVRMAGALYQSYDKRPYMEKVEQFLERAGLRAEDRAAVR